MKKDLIVELLQSLTNPSSLKRQEAVKRLVALADQILPWLVGALEMKEYSSVWPQIIEIIQSIGTRSSVDAAVPILMRYLKDSNKPIYVVAFDALRTMGERVIYEARDILAYNWSDDAWVQNVCLLLAGMRSQNQEILVSDLVTLIDIGSKKNPIDEMALKVLGNIQSPKVNVALPLLGKKLSDMDREEFKIDILEYFRRFDKEIVHQLYPFVEACLRDTSELTRTKAQELLEWLNRSN